MRHKHCEMICAKAENTDLVVFFQFDGFPWAESSELHYLPSEESNSYFLCLPQHKEVCLHWLNGGSVQYASNGTWVSFGNCKDWSVNHLFMKSDVNTRIKPRKEKRWVAVAKGGISCVDHTFHSEEIAKTYIKEFHRNPTGYQYLEIEVEV